MNVHKVIFDTDPGVDDAIALYFALAHPRIDLVGITTSFGNVSVDQAATNALHLTALTNRHIPVTKGIGKPLAKFWHGPPDFIHGSDGLGNLPARGIAGGILDARPSAQFIVDMVRAYPGEITLVAVGPVGNLAIALALEPALPVLVREVILMGGSIVEPGNVSPVAEANIWNDPHAADIVFQAGWPLTMVGLDVTHRVVTELALFEKIAQHHQHPATDDLLHAVKFYATFYSGLHKHLDATTPGCYAHDLLAFIYLVAPELFRMESGCVRVATEGLAQGQTMMDRRPYIDYPQRGWSLKQPQTRVCMDVNAPACLQLFEETLLTGWL